MGPRSRADVSEKRNMSSPRLESKPEWASPCRSHYITELSRLSVLYSMQVVPVDVLTSHSDSANSTFMLLVGRQDVRAFIHRGNVNINGPQNSVARSYVFPQALRFFLVDFTVYIFNLPVSRLLLYKWRVAWVWKTGWTAVREGKCQHECNWNIRQFEFYCIL